MCFIARKRGFILITSVIFMLVLTLVVVYAVRSATVYERVAGNNRNHSQAFQAAEYALAQARGALVEEPPAVSASGCTGGACPKSYDTSRFDSPAFWIANQAATCAVNAACNNRGANKVPVGTPASFPSATGEQPRYVVRELGTASPGGKSCNFYEITAFGQGSNAQSASILRSVVKACDS
ncbi:PilX N-terminal domain-containing pilus assembly protein [Chitiniphilus purpureus]|uniref:PilX N-terminal domain-containing pilus assembly protein n=1 Tax=Chitiniphilus purpureus TaxID=2981137 RepID=A0ABY6DMS0_9NEIS|nr:PilX N-terminal domain-containing pilus assembly protein [Chitiniphilus sp. CD1]UXY15649.1 PilX N-terminal domain-containing pilus assembly protein [Chitiniphilus sp. CD1]